MVHLHCRSWFSFQDGGSSPAALARVAAERGHSALGLTDLNTVAGAGVWLDQGPGNRAKAVNIAAGRKFFNQDPNIIRFVMENPTDRVTYGDMRMIRSEFDDLMQLSIQAGTLKAPVPYEKYVDESFVKAAKPATIAL